MRKVVDEALLKCFQKSVTRQFNQSKPLVELDYVQARVSEVTHEVNNPLAIVQNYLHTLSLKIDENSQVQTDIQTISREMLRISDIVKKYGQIGQQEDLLREEININVLLEELSSVFRGGHESITFNLQLDTAMPLVLIIPDSLKQVIVNLLKNALEAIGNMPQGQISIASHGSINFGGDQYIEILITDNGPGIPLSIRDKLFLKNHSSKGSGHSGLGLSIVKQLLSEMGGLISCRSQVEGEGSAGTSFQILIPLINNE
jgi:signal transduction histidine kinase